MMQTIIALKSIKHHPLNPIEKTMKEFEEKAKELVNKIYQPLGYLKCGVSNDDIWEWAKKRAEEQVKVIKGQLPMYTGNLNPKWEYWDKIEKALKIIP